MSGLFAKVWLNYGARNGGARFFFRIYRIFRYKTDYKIFSKIENLTKVSEKDLKNRFEYSFQNKFSILICFFSLEKSHTP